MSLVASFLVAALLFASATPALADAITGQTEKQPLNLLAVGMFLTFVVITLGITKWAASRNFPVLVMSIFWRGMTTRGALIGGFLGLTAAGVGVVLSPGIWVDVLGYPKGTAPFPYSNPSLFSMTLAFIGIWLGSITDRSARSAEDRAGFDAQFVRAQTGLGAEGASSH